MKFVPSRVVIAATLFFCVAWIAAQHFIPMFILYDAMNGAGLAIAVLLTLIYAPVFWQSVVKIESRVNLLALGFGLVWFSYIGQRVVSFIYRMTGRETELLNNPYAGFFVFLGLIAACLQVAAPGYPPDGFKERFGGRYRWFIVGAIVGGAVVAVIMRSMKLFGG